MGGGDVGLRPLIFPVSRLIDSKPDSVKLDLSTVWIHGWETRWIALRSDHERLGS